MSIKLKILVVFFAIMATIAGSLFLFSQTVLLNKFVEIENEQITKDLELVISSVRRDIDDLHKTTTNFANLNSTIQFINEANSVYLATNFSRDDFENLNLAITMIKDTDGTILFGKEYNNGQLVDVTPEIIDQLENNGYFDVNGGGSSGFLVINDRVMNVVSHPIDMRNGNPSDVGIIILARELDDDYLNNSLVSLNYPVSVLLYENLINSPSNNSWIDELSTEQPILIQRVNAHLINAYAHFPDYPGGNSFVLALEKERVIFLEGRNAIFLFIGIIVAIGWTGALVMVLMYSRIIFKPLAHLRGIANTLSTGDFSVDLKNEKKDEIGEVYRSLDNLTQFLLDIARSMQKIAIGDLTVNVTPQSEKDTLSQSIASMVSSLKEKLMVFQKGSRQVNKASEELTLNAKEATNSTSQITNTIQQVAQGIADQTSSVNKTAAAVEKLSQAIDGVTNGTNNQARAVEAASLVTAQITETIRFVMDNIHNVADESDNAAKTAADGSQTVTETLEGMKLIKEKMEVSSQKMLQMRNRSEEIADIVISIEEIASQTNLLALNAAIEAARAESQANQLVEMILNKQMLTQAGLIDRLLLDNDQRSEGFWLEVAQKTGMDIISIANQDGVNEFSSDKKLIGFRYSDNPAEQSYVFRQLLGKTNGTVCQPPRKRNIDGKMYKYVGLSRSDKKGFIQVGFNSDSLTAFQFQVGGFAVVASEVYRLAENARESAKSITNLIKEIRLAVGEAAKAMDESSTEVEKGYQLAGRSTTVLETILSSVREVSRQAELAASTAQKMNSFTSELVHSMDAVSNVVEHNLSATMDMTNNSKEVSQEIESFASVSEQNSAAVEEVSASTEEMKAQADLVSTAAEELMILANSLQEAVLSFKLEGSDGEV